MKKLVVILSVLLASIGLNAQFTKASLQASGLTCSMCNNAIYKALKALPFVASVGSNIKNSSFDVVFKENAVADIDALRKAVEDAGFSVASFNLTGNFDKVAIGNDKHVVIDGRHFIFLKVNDQVLNGEKTITVVDKGFLTVKNFKKYSADAKIPSIQTGRAGTGLEGEGLSAGTRIYHVTI